MKLWRFGAPKTPGFGLSKSYYLSVLSSASVLPSIEDVIVPKPEYEGPVVGFGAPLRAGATKEELRQPMRPGAYAIADRSRKTVCQMLLMGKEDAGFNPETFAQSALAMDFSAETVARIRGTWTIAQFTFQSHDPDVFPSLDFLQDVTARLASLSEGVIADPISRRYLLPSQVRLSDRLDPKFDAREHVSVQFRTVAGANTGYTLGMQKFALPEFELATLLDHEMAIAERFLILLAQTALIRSPMNAGDRTDGFVLAEGGFDRAVWEGIPVLEVLPPTSQMAGDALRDWADRVLES